MAVLASFNKIDYDEYTQVHFVWLVTQGLSPYTDFHAVHPPFLWYLYAPIMRLLPERIESIIFLRLITLCFSVGTLFLMARMIFGLFRDPADRLLGVAAIVTMATQPRVLSALSEFRVDQLSTLLTFLALLLSCRPEGRVTFLKWMSCSFLFVVAMGLNAKMVLVPIVATIVTAVSVARVGRERLRMYLLGTSAGMALGLSLLLTACLIQELDFRRLYEQVFVYHSIFKGEFTRKFGLAKTLFSKPGQQLGRTFLSWAIGVMAMLRTARGGRWHKNQPVLILGLYALLQPLWIPFPYKQYSYTIYLAWAFPLAIGLVTIRKWNHKIATALSAYLMVTGLYLQGTQDYRTISRNEAGWQISQGNAILDLAPRGQPVVAQPPLHPIFRRDSTFGWIISYNPDGPETEDIMSRFPAYANHFSYEGYLSELRADPPGLIVVNANAGGKEYRRAIARFLSEVYPQEYVDQFVGDVRVLIRK